MILRKFALPVILVFGLAAKAGADTLYLKNGRRVEGMVVKEYAKTIEVEVGFGKIQFLKDEVDRISKSTPEEAEGLQEKWQRRQEEEKRGELKKLSEAKKDTRETPETQTTDETKQSTAEKPKKYSPPIEADLDPSLGQIVVNALINHKIRCSLIVDTGASMVVLSNNIGKQLGVNLNPENEEGNLPFILADGSTAYTKYVRLDSLIVEGREVTNLDAAVLMGDEDVSPGGTDGLLGLSFLNDFNFQVDQENKKLILEQFEP